MKIMVIGSGGREHSIIWKLSQSPKVSKIYCAPGNAGISRLAECVNIKPSDINGLKFFVQNHDVDLTIVGPEVPLVNGIVNEFEKLGLKIFGPDFQSSRLEGSKIFAKRVMKTFNIPTADFMLFDDPYTAKKMIEFMNQPLVIKADGLAGGKGVFVCDGKEDGIEAVDKIMVQKIFGDAGNFIVVEKRLEGIEMSFMAFTDGGFIVPMPVTRDYKKLSKNDNRNTGGVACYGPVDIDEKLYDEIIDTIMAPLIAGLSKQGIVYKGVIYAGLMIDKNNKPKVLEFNCRFGDPESSILMSLLETDLIDIIEAIEKQKLNKIEVKWKDKSVVCVVPYSKGYPDSYEIGKEIFGLDNEYIDTQIFHSGTKLDNNKIVSNGGRVLSITSIGNSLQNARDKVYYCIDNINFDGMCYRKDILIGNS